MAGGKLLQLQPSNPFVWNMARAQDYWLAFLALPGQSDLSSLEGLVDGDSISVLEKDRCTDNYRTDSLTECNNVRALMNVPPYACSYHEPKPSLLISTESYLF